MAEESRPVGRPSVYSEEIDLEICRRLIEGESLRKICADAHMPAMSSIMLWLADDTYPDFSERYARARDLQGDTDADDIGDIARKAAAGEIDAASATAAINGLKWTAGKRKPLKYGDRTTVKHTGAVGTFDPTKCTDAQLAQLEAILGPIAAASDDAGSDQGGEGQAGG